MENEKINLKAISEGDKKAFSDFFYAYHHHYGHYVFSIVKSHELTEEIIQDVFLKLWEQREKLPTIQNITAYLFIITKNHTLNAIRKMATERKKQQVWENEVASSASDEGNDNAQERDQLLAHAVSNLPPQQQKVFLLRQQGMKNEQIATQMCISPLSAKKYQQLAIQSIQKFVRAKVTAIVLLGALLNFF